MARGLQQAGLRVCVFDAADRPGGKIQTVRLAGCQIETGPNTLLLNKPALTSLIHQLGLTPQLIDAAPAARRRWVYHRDRLCPLPSGPLSALTSPLLGPRAIATLAAEFLGLRPGLPAASASQAAPESVARFIRRRFGGKVLKTLVEPFLTGVYAGDVERLEAQAVLGALVDAERQSGSVIRGMLHDARARRRALASQPPPDTDAPAAASPKSKRGLRSVTLSDGLQTLPDAMAARLGADLRLGQRVHRVQPAPHGGVELLLADGPALHARHVILAGSAPANAEVLADWPETHDLRQRMLQQEQTSLAVVALVVPRERIGHRLGGFGFLSARTSVRHPLRILGCIFRSEIFPHTAPPGMACLVCFLGGAHDPAAVTLADGELLALCQADLARTIGLQPDAIRDHLVRRWQPALPHLVLGQTALRQAVRSWSAEKPVSIIGPEMTGPSIGDCVTVASELASELVRRLKTPTP